MLKEWRRHWVCAALSPAPAEKQASRHHSSRSAGMTAAACASPRFQVGSACGDARLSFPYETVLMWTLLATIGETSSGGGLQLDLACRSHSKGLRSRGRHPVRTAFLNLPHHPLLPISQGRGISLFPRAVNQKQQEGVRELTGRGGVCGCVGRGMVGV